jgi:hypothetical protein
MLYKHYQNNNVYRFDCEALDPETEELFVVYSQIKDRDGLFISFPKRFVTTRERFFAVGKEFGKQYCRFTPVADSLQQEASIGRIIGTNLSPYKAGYHE